LTANGTASVTVSDGKVLTATIVEALRYGHFRVDGQIDLARIARMLPTTLKIREGTHVATGDITLALASEIDTGGQRWDGRIEAKNLSAMHEGRHLTWDQPVVVTAAAWSIFVLLLPFLGVFVYLVVHGGDMTKRDVASAKQSEAAFQAYVRDAAGTSGGGAADELTKLADLHSKGLLSDEEFAQQKAKILA
jgi:hypothetical protein